MGPYQQERPAKKSVTQAKINNSLRLGKIFRLFSFFFLFFPGVFSITGEIESCDFEPPDGATLETLDKHWQNY